MNQPTTLGIAIDNHGHRLLWKCPECGEEVTRLVESKFGIHYTTIRLPKEWRCKACLLQTKLVDRLGPILGRRFSLVLF